jgi:hypothetical protein
MQVGFMSTFERSDGAHHAGHIRQCQSEFMARLRRWVVKRIRPLLVTSKSSVSRSQFHSWRSACRYVVNV